MYVIFDQWFFPLTRIWNMCYLWEWNTCWLQKTNWFPLYLLWKKILVISFLFEKSHDTTSSDEATKHITINSSILYQQLTLYFTTAYDFSWSFQIFNCNFQLKTTTNPFQPPLDITLSANNLPFYKFTYILSFETPYFTVIKAKIIFLDTLEFYSDSPSFLLQPLYFILSVLNTSLRVCLF